MAVFGKQLQYAYIRSEQFAAGRGVTYPATKPTIVTSNKWLKAALFRPSLYMARRDLAKLIYLASFQAILFTFLGFRHSQF
jgi:hypothetical protein